MTKLFKNSKQLISFVLAFAVLAMSLFTGTALTVSATSDTLYWDGSTYTQPTDDDGDGVYIIDTAAKLAYLACKTKDNTYETYGKTYKVADGIKSIVLQPESLAAIKDKTSAAEVKAFFDENATSAKWWNVVGYNGAYPFQGTFDGNGATIYGIYANWASYADWHSDLYAGLFGLVDQGAVIKNVAVKNSYLTSKNGFIGAIFANSARATTDWNATANRGTGDIVVENCVAANNYMNVPSDSYNNRNKLGVLLGAADYDYLKLNNCMVFGNDAKTDMVTPDGATFDIPFIGALNGDKVDGKGVNSVANVISLGATPYNRYNFGWGSYVHHEGNNTGTNCFKNVYTDQPIGNFTMYNNQSQYLDFASKAMPNLTSVTAEGIIGADAIDAMSELDWANAWFAVRDGMPELRAFHTAFTATDNGDGTHSESCDNGALVGVAQAHTDTDENYICDVCRAELPRPDTSVIYWDGSTYTQPTDDDGDGVYIIDTAAKLAYIACKTQSNTYETYGKTYKVADGIKSIVLQPESLAAIKDKTTAAEVKAFFDENAGAAKWWNVVGYNGQYPFQGTFDGNGATIYGIYANWASYADWHSDLYAGLFGLVDQGAVIKNVAVKNSYLTSKNGFIGAIFANSARATADWNATANRGTGDIVVENCVAANNYMNAPTENYNNRTKFGVLLGAADYDYLKLNNCMAYGNDAKTDIVTPDSEVFDIPFIGALNGDKVDGKGVNSVANVISLGATPYNRYNFGYGSYVHHEGNNTGTNCFKNVYTDQPLGYFTMYNNQSQYLDFASKAMPNLTSVTAEGIIGADAIDAMSELDWANAWFAVRDGMPELRAFHTAFTATNNGDGTHSESCDDCGLAGVAMAHDWSAADGYCTVCGAVCQHGFDIDENGALVFEATVPGDCVTPAQGHFKCSICGLTDPELIEDPAGAPGHDWSNADGICAECGAECEHNWSNGTCTICGVTCEHDWSNADGICATCGAECQHGFDVDPENGSLVFEATVSGDCETPAQGHIKCSICGLTDPEVIEDPEGAPGHDWSNKDGICAECGAECEHDFGDGDTCTICGKPNVELGDANGDGKVNNKDLALLMQKLNGWNVEIDDRVADVNGDGKVNNKDYALLMQFVNGWEVELG